MGELIAFSQSSILLPQIHCHSLRQRQHSLARLSTPYLVVSPFNLMGKSSVYPLSYAQPKQFSWCIRASVMSDSKVPTTFTADSAGERIDVLPDTSSGAGDDYGDTSGNSGGGGGGGGGDDAKNNSNEDEGGSDEGEDPSDAKNKKKGMSMSQKLTLGYAFLVGAGGIMGFLKSGSQKSLIAGGVSASLLYLVYTLLPTSPVIASSLGFGLSASLLMVMGSRFKRSGKIFPAGIVSFVSLVMSAGYVHGILRSVH